MLEEKEALCLYRPLLILASEIFGYYEKERTNAELSSPGTGEDLEDKYVRFGIRAIMQRDLGVRMYHRAL